MNPVRTRARRTTRWAVLLALAGTTLLAAASPARAESATIGTSVEAWYQGSVVPGDHPLCVMPCPEFALPESSYPEDTLHVGVSAGREVARTYLELDLSALPLPVTLAGGSLHLPVAGPDAGTTAPELADLVACPVAGFVQPAQGGPPDQAPEADCAAAAAGLTFDAEEQAFNLDLAPLLPGAPTYANLPIAIVASDTAREEGATWRVVFHGRDRDTEDAEPITGSIRYVPPDAGGLNDPTSEPTGPADTPADPTSAAPAPAPSLDLPAPTIEPPPSSSGGHGPVVEEPVVAEPAPTPTAPQPVAAAPVASGYAYPQVWLLPLLVLGAGTLLVQSLTREYEVDPASMAGS